MAMSAKGGTPVFAAFLACLALPPASALAQGAGQVQEKVWMHAGEINRIDKRAHKIVVNDLSFKIIPASRLISANGQRTIVSDLEAGQVAGVDYRNQPGLGRVVERLRVFRPGQEPRLDEDE
jgi:hypothetical protein